ncbi:MULTISPECIES: hypothetical protein [unclassified Mesorhizobium]|nr:MULTISPECIES: hypothetical protein [unclassified Mesorhizobium]TGQ47838.1 hypothetical protein EN859_001270 [Mesorhizobium sp. M00.F.Ca.ET.216.01.1.1]TIS58862.1 MAG: hypothetical protein E5W91_07735 [Mesorhizobium sp.]TJW17892.1 MAG: hypothetical protein E5W82_02625 [Mesorhizobium sp.]
MAAGAAYLLALVALERGGWLPPPAFTNNLCADAKLAFLRDHPPKAPTELILGSSAAWRGIASEEIVRRHPTARPLNGSFCGLQVNQTAFVADYLLRRYPSVQSVLLLLSPIDMDTCSGTDARLFDRRDVDAYLASKGPVWSYYFRYFDPVSLVRNASLVKAAREDRLPFYSLIFTPYGDGPQTTDASRKLDIGLFDTIDPACVPSLRRLARTIADGGRRLTVASLPLLSAGVERSDPTGAIHDHMVREVKSAVVGTNAVFWDGERFAQVDPGDFVDPIHLRWTGARRFTRQLVAATGFGAVK